MSSRAATATPNPQSAAGSAAGTIGLGSWRERLTIGLMLAVSLGFPLIRTTDLGSNVTVRDTSYAEGSILLPAVFGTLFLVAAWRVWRYREIVWRQARSINPFLLLLLAWCACTMLWSPYPLTTLRRTVQFAGLVLIGLSVVPPLGGTHQITRTALATLTVLLLVSVLTVLVAPGTGIDYMLGNAWRGLLWHKNTLGMAAAFCFLLWVRELRSRQLGVMLCLAGCVFSLFVLVMAKSTTALIVAVAGLAIYLALARRYVAYRHASLSVVLLGLAAVLVALQIFYTMTGRLPYWHEIAQPVAGLFNKDANLTGRTDLWELTLLEAMRHPWHGIGYGAFWLGTASPSQYVIDALHYMPLQAHNGYIDVFNELGIVGLVLLFGFVVTHALALSRLMRIDREEAAIHTAFFVLILITNITETQLFRGVQFQYVWLVYSSIIVSATVRFRRGQAAGA